MSFYKYQIFALILLSSSIKVLAETFEVDGLKFSIIQSDGSNEVALEKKTGGYAGDIIIPETVSYQETTYSVTQIEGFCFAQCTNLTSVSIPQSVIYVGLNAFYGCSGLKKLTLVDSSIPGVEPIEFTSESTYSQPFNDLSLEELYIGRNVAHSNDLIWSLPSLRKVTIGPGVTYLRDKSFTNCTNLSDLTIRASWGDGSQFPLTIGVGKSGGFFDPIYGLFAFSPLTSAFIDRPINADKASIFQGSTLIKNVAFGSSLDGVPARMCDHCYSLESVEMPQSYKYIGAFAFQGCSNLKSFTLPEFCDSIGTWAFYGCYNLETVNFNSRLRRIEDTVFDACNLSNITLPASLEYIGKYAFQYSKIQSITIPENVVVIDNSAFFSCLSLKEITLLGSPNIADRAFLDCPLENIYSHTSTPGILAETSFPSSTYVSANLFVPVGSLSAYEDAPVWKYFINLKESDFSSIVDVIKDECTSEIIGYYSIKGEFQRFPFEGINIVLFANGVTKKIYIRK